MTAPFDKTPDRRRLRWALVLAGLVLFIAAPPAALWWLTRGSMEAEVVSIGGRYRQQLIDPFLTAAMKSIQWRQPTIFHWIDLEDSRVDDAWLRAHADALRRQTDLSLFLRETQVTTQGLTVLRDMDNIDCLNLIGTPLDDSAVETFVTLPRLIQLYIGRTGISGAALAGLSPSPHLVFLCIDSTQASEQGIAGLATCPSLRGLWVLDADDACVLRIAGRLQLTSLNLNGERLTTACFPALQKLQQMQVLTLYDTDFTEAELAGLKQALPGCTIQQLDFDLVQAQIDASWE